MPSLIRTPSETAVNIATRIAESEKFVRDTIVPILEAEPRLRVGPEDYTHAVKFVGKHRVGQVEMIPVIRQVLAESKDITLYAHMPVCRYRCSFCHYPVVVSRNASEPRSYVELLMRESETFRETAPEITDKVVTSLYVGGGTPTLMENEDILRILNYFRTSYHLSPNCEITMEGTPETFDDAKIEAVLDAGVNRVSVGVQVLDDSLLARCNRQHTVEQAISSVKKLLAAGFEKLNVDLIYGLPGQSIQKFARDVDLIAQVRPTSVTIYRLRLRRTDELSNTGMLRLYRDNPGLFPQPETTYGMQVVGRKILEGYGYLERPSGWFSLPGYNVQVYEDRWFRQVPLVAFGWRTYSYSRQYEYHNFNSRRLYGARVHSSQLPLEVCTLFDVVEICRRYIEFSLKSSFALDNRGSASRLGGSVKDDEFSSNFNPKLVSLGLARPDGERILLTDAGKVIVEEVISRLIRTEVLMY